MSRIAVVSAGLSEPSSSRLLADQLASAVVAASPSAPEVRVIELRSLAHEIVNNLLTGFPSGALKEALSTVMSADGLIAVTPIFSASYSGLFKSFFDVVEHGALTGKPVLIGATAGTARHSLALEYAIRPMFAYLRSAVVPTAVFAGPEDWAGGRADAALGARIERAGQELAQAMQRRPTATAPDPFALTTTFDQLLAGD